MVIVSNPLQMAEEGFNWAEYPLQSKLVQHLEKHEKEQIKLDIGFTFEQFINIAECLLARSAADVDFDRNTFSFIAPKPKPE